MLSSTADSFQIRQARQGTQIATQEILIGNTEVGDQRGEISILRDIQNSRGLRPEQPHLVGPALSQSLN